MSGISIIIEADGFDKVFKRLQPLFDFEPSALMTGIAALGESQTRRRISEEKTAPDGSAWKPNAEGTSILLQTGQHLLQSIAWEASADTAEWGATWEYAHVHQDGMTIVPRNAKNLVFKIAGKTIAASKVTIPARPFVGLSADNEMEMEELITDFLGGLAQ
jgi:phage virion morphogenesis protein